MSNFKKVLHNEDGLEIAFLVEDEQARIEFRANLSYDLGSSDDVVVVVNGKGIAPNCESSDFAVANLGPWDDYTRPISLMIRVGEFFDGWEFE